jgi:hypothetical protein
MPLETAKQRIASFHQRHGGECYLDGGFYWYEDGAYRDEDPMGVLSEPPDPSTEDGECSLLERKLRFYRAKFKKAVKQFESLRESLSCSVPADEEAALEKLEELRQIVEVRQEEVRRAEDKLDNSSIGVTRRGVREFQAKESARYDEWRSKLRSVRI